MRARGSGDGEKGGDEDWRGRLERKPGEEGRGSYREGVVLEEHTNCSTVCTGGRVRAARARRM